MSNTRERGSLSLDGLDDDKIAPPAPEQVKAIADKTGFGRTHEQAKPTPVAKPRGKAKAETKAKGKERPRRRTGRTAPISTNIKPSSHEQLLDLVDIYSEREDRPVSKAEVLERGIAALLKKEQEEGDL